MNEIRILDRGADISIDIETRSMNVEYISYGENTIPLDSKEAVEILDSWFTKWTLIIHNLRGQTDRIIKNEQMFYVLLATTANM